MYEAGRLRRRRSPCCLGRIALALAMGGVAWLPMARMAGANAPAPAAASGALPAALAPLGADPRVHSLWAEGEALERREELLAAAQHYEQIEALLPGSAYLQWRISRNYWRHAERIPVDDKRSRMHYFGLADTWAGRALENDPECGECVLWKLAAMGRLATTGGVVQAMQLASTIRDMIERGIALHPTHHDEGRANVALANLYYAGAAFYRIVPDWVWVQWVLGVRGDRERALEYIRKALAISDPRVDYQVELGAVLLCLGSERRDAQLLDEGREALRAANGIARFQSTDEIDLGHARILLAEPERACGYSRDGWISASEVRRP